MATFQCIYTGKQFPEDERVEAPILPYSLGGSDELVLRDVSRQALAQTEQKVDAPFVDSLPITLERLAHQVRGREGALPSLSLRGTLDINGESTPTRYTFSEDGRTLLVRPEMAPEEDALRIGCQPEQLPEIAALLHTKLPGGSLPPIDLGKILQQAAGSQIQLERPVLQGLAPISWTVFPREMVRIALAFGSYCLGPAFSSSAEAQVLRDYVMEDDAQKRAQVPLKGSAWPPMPAQEDANRGPHQVAQHHVLAVTNSESLIFYGLLFGRYSASVLLSRQPQAFEDRVPPGDGIVMLVNFQTREVRRYGYKDFFLKRLLNQL